MKEEIQKIIKGEVSDDPSIREKASTDASIFKVSPELVVYPKDSDDLSNLIKFVSEKNKNGESLTLAPRVGGTCMSGGSLTEGIVLDMTKYFNGVGEVKDGRINVMSGAFYRDLEKETLKSGMELASYTSSKNICGVGGMLGDNASGERSIKFGATDRQVISFRAILSDGNIYEFRPLNRVELEEVMKREDLFGRVHKEIYELIEKNEGKINERFPRVKKNAAGYALNEVWNKDKTEFNLGRLFIGSQGTLGIITEATFKLVPILENVQMLVVPLSKLSGIPKIVKIFRKHNADIVETFDYHTYNLAKTYLSEDAMRAKIADGEHMVIFAEWGGENVNDVESLMEIARKEIEECGFSPKIVSDESEALSFLNIRRASFKMLLDHPYPDTRAAAFLEDTIVDIEKYDKFLERLEKILEDYDLTYTYAGHIGDGSIRLVPLINFEKERAQEMILELAEKVYDLVFEFGGSMSVDHNDGYIRTPFLEKMYGEEIAGLFKEVKRIFDPQKVFNGTKKSEMKREESLRRILTKNR